VHSANTASPRTQDANMNENITLIDFLPTPDSVDADSLLAGFLSYTEGLALTLYPAQEEAILELFEGSNVILNTPTGSGKSLVALALHFKALAEGKRCFYTAPIKALVSEKFFDLCRALGAENVGMMTGDASVNREAPIICCTAEILSNLALRDGELADVDFVIMDEFHYYSDRDRGVAWQVPLLTLPQARFLLMSATLGKTQRFEEELLSRTGARTCLVRSTDRPVPLEFLYGEKPLHETIQDLVSAGKFPVYIVHFTQRSATEQAQNLMSVDLLTRDEKAKIKEELRGFRFDTPFGTLLKRFVLHGVGIHHAGLLPKYRLVVEKLAQQGHLRLICGTDTLGVGVNIPIRSVLFTQLCKFDGESTKVLTVRHFQQIAGRAGRRGFDTEGTVVAQAPEHVIENQRARNRVGDDAKKLRKLRMKKPPTRGYAPWDEARFTLMQTAEPEALVSRFSVSHAMLLHVLGRPADGCSAMKALIRASHESKKSQRALGRQSITMLRSLMEAGVVELDPGQISVNADLQSDFSLNQSLSLYVLDAIEALPDESPEYAHNVTTVVESILENPRAILLKQLDRVKSQKIAEWKAEGVEYDERIRRLEELEYPKPLREFIYDSFNAFAAKHPWVGAENIRPKSIVREMYEEGFSFREYVKEYGLARSEGVLLRYLSNAYKALVQNVPEDAKTDSFYDICEWLGAVVHQVDSSLIEAWESLINPEEEAEAPVRSAPVADVPELLRDLRRFEILVRNASWRLVVNLSRQRWESIVESLHVPVGETRWSVESLDESMEPYWSRYDAIMLDTESRSNKHLAITRGESTWSGQQTLSDPEGDLTWVLRWELDLDASVEAGAPRLTLLSVSD